MNTCVSKLLLTLNAPIATKVVCFSRLLKCLRSLYGKQCGPTSDCSYRSSLFWVHAVCFYTKFVSNVRQLFAAGDFSRRHFQMFFLGALMVKVTKSAFMNIFRKKNIFFFKVGKRAKIRNRYNQAPHLNQDTSEKVKTSHLDITNESQEVSRFPFKVCFYN